MDDNTNNIIIHDFAPDMPAEQQRKLTVTIVTDVHAYIRRREAEGIKELWTWIKNGQNIVAYFYQRENDE